MAKPKLTVSSNDKAITSLVSKTDHKVLVIWAADCTERVLHYFERKYSEDDRPGNAIKAGRDWAQGKRKMTDVRKAAVAAHAAARDVIKVAEACSAARAAGHAAATAHVSTHAVYAAIYAATAVRDGIYSTDPNAAVVSEREWQYQHLLELGKH